MKVALYTLGCRVNSYESEAMAEQFIKEGYDVVDFSEFADVYVINTCTVTNMGDKKSRQMIESLKSFQLMNIRIKQGLFLKFKMGVINFVLTA